MTLTLFVCLWHDVTKWSYQIRRCCCNSSLPSVRTAPFIGSADSYLYAFASDCKRSLQSIMPIIRWPWPGRIYAVGTICTLVPSHKVAIELGFTSLLPSHLWTALSCDCRWGTLPSPCGAYPVEYPAVISSAGRWSGRTIYIGAQSGYHPSSQRHFKWSQPELNRPRHRDGTIYLGGVYLARF